MLQQDEIDEQLRLLATHRRTLSVYLQQQASIGKSFSPPGLVNGIAETRGNIKHIKDALQSAGIPVPADPDDDEPPTPAFVPYRSGQLPSSGMLIGLAAAALIALGLGLAWAFGRPGTASTSTPTIAPTANSSASGEFATAAIQATSQAETAIAEAQATSQAETAIAEAQPTSPQAGVTAVATSNETSLPASSGLLREYDFSNGDEGWSGESAEWQVVNEGGNQVYEGHAPADLVTASSPPDLPVLANYAVEARVRIVEAGTNDDQADWWFSLRGNDASDRCESYGFYYFSEDRQAFIMRNGNGSCFSVLTQQEVAINVGTWYTIRAEVVGEDLKLFIDGTEVLAASDTQLSEGYFYMNVGPNAVVQFDDIRVFQL